MVKIGRSGRTTCPTVALTCVTMPLMGAINCMRLDKCSLRSCCALSMSRSIVERWVCERDAFSSSSWRCADRSASNCCRVRMSPLMAICCASNSLRFCSTASVETKPCAKSDSCRVSWRSRSASRRCDRASSRSILVNWLKSAAILDWMDARVARSAVSILRNSNLAKPSFRSVSCACAASKLRPWVNRSEVTSPTTCPAWTRVRSATANATSTPGSCVTNLDKVAEPVV